VAHASFKGLRVLSLESRRAKEVEKLIRTYGGEAIVVPAMREVGLESNEEALEFAAGLLGGEFDLVVFLTGVGVRAMLDVVQTQFDREEIITALRKVKIENGEVVQRFDMSPSYFGEGIAILGNRIIQLTWTSHKAFVYNLSDFQIIGQFPYEGEG